jgi:predicted dehydrogenase/nucleoside-diphosphate-sugar epimerase
MPDRQVDLAIIGCGAITELAHLPATAGVAGLRVTALVDQDLQRAETLARRHGVPQAAAGPAQLDPPPDAVLIAVPHHLHAPVSLEWLRRGVHVMVEKPMALTAADCDSMIRAAGEAGVQLAVGLVRRFLPVTRLVKAILGAGVLGPLASFDVREGRVYDWPVTSDSLLRRASAGGGVLVDSGAHVLDALLFWLGELEVLACCDDSCGGVDADAEIRLALPGGVRGTVELSRTRELRNTVRIQGAAGTLEASFLTGKITLRHGAEIITVETDADLPCLAGSAEGMDLFRAQLADWVAAIQSGGAPAVPGHEGRRSVALIEQCLARRRPLVLPWVVPEPPPEAPAPSTPPAPSAPSSPPAPSAVRAVSSSGGGALGLRGRSVLVTGGTGFIGGRLVEKLVLEQGARVRILVRDFARACRVARFEVELVAGDVTDPAAVDRAAGGCAVIFHCAYGNRGSAEEQRAVNVGGTQAVVGGALRAGVSRLVHVSTISVYGGPLAGDLDEATPYRPPGDLYAATKAEAEQLVLDAHRRHGLAAAVVQPTIVYGPFGLAWTIDPLAQLGSRRVVLVDGGDGLCNAVYVDDVADALILAGTQEAAVGEAFLISGAAPVTWKRFYAAYERMLGVAATLPTSAADLLSLARRREEDEQASREMLARLRQSGFTASHASSATPFRVPSAPMIEFFAARARVRIDKAKRLLGYRPRFDLERGMNLTAAWARWAGLLGGGQSLGI